MDSKAQLNSPSLTEAVLMACAMALVGVAYGAMTTGAGFPIWVAPLLGVIVLAGSAEMLYVGLAATASAWVALPAALLVNVRHVPYGMALREALGHGAGRAMRAHVLNDESVAFALARRDVPSARSALNRIGAAVLIGWPLGAFVGSLLGRGIDQEKWGLDAIFPAVILALVIPALKRARLRPAIIGAAIVSIPGALLLPQGLGPLVGVLALPLAMWRTKEVLESRKEAGGVSPGAGGGAPSGDSGPSGTDASGRGTSGEEETR